jgi:hypothetical protein
MQTGTDSTVSHPPQRVDSESAARWIGIILGSLHREYPNQIAHVLSSDADARPPRELTPAFFGCYDWHSAVHGHWSIVRLLRFFPEADWRDKARQKLAQRLTREHLYQEADFLRQPGREGFERPYGLAWLLQLAAELREWDDAFAVECRAALLPLEELAVSRLATWLRRLSHPIRSGEHSQSAFAMGLAFDWARIVSDAEFERLLARRALDFYVGDRTAPVDYEPSGHDFLSPVLGEADLLRRILPSVEFAGWLRGFLPGLRDDCVQRWLTPVTSADDCDGKLAHLHGLNLSRAWMLEGIASALAADDDWRDGLLSVAARHREAGLAAVSGEQYTIAHWLTTFAVYHVTGRGLGGIGGAERSSD